MSVNDVASSTSSFWTGLFPGTEAQESGLSLSKWSLGCQGSFCCPEGTIWVQEQRGSLILSPTWLFSEALGQVEDFLQGPVWAAGGLSRLDSQLGSPLAAKALGGIWAPAAATSSSEQRGEAPPTGGQRGNRFQSRAGLP